MPLGQDYEKQDCSLARALEVVGERWTLLVLRDCFWGVRRFSDLLAHLDVPRAVLTRRLRLLVDEGLLEKRRYRPGRDEYVLTDRGLRLWPAVHALARWGERYYSDAGPRRIFSHVACGTDLDEAGRCPGCGNVPHPGELQIRPGPGADPGVRDDPVSRALRDPHRLLEPLLPAGS